MELSLDRFSGGEEATLGLLFLQFVRLREFLCFTLEDEYRAIKVKGETRIAAGRYEIRLRTEGGMHPKYAARYPLIHKGMLWLQDVPNFQWVYIHSGNVDDHTDGCILTGDGVMQNITEEGRLLASRAAYQRIYVPIAHAIISGAGAWITIRDPDDERSTNP